MSYNVGKGRPKMVKAYFYENYVPTFLHYGKSYKDPWNPIEAEFILIV